MPWKIRLDRCNTQLSPGLIEFLRLGWLEESEREPWHAFLLSNYSSSDWELCQSFRPVTPISWLPTAHPLTITETKASGDLRTGAALMLKGWSSTHQTFWVGVWQIFLWDFEAVKIEGTKKWEKTVLSVVCYCLFVLILYLIQAQVWRGTLWESKLLWYFQLILNCFETVLRLCPQVISRAPQGSPLRFMTPPGHLRLLVAKV